MLRLAIYLAVMFSLSLPVTAQEPVRLMLAGRFDAQAALFTTAQDNGHFSISGIKVEIAPSEEGPRETWRALLEGRADLAVLDFSLFLRLRDGMKEDAPKAVMMLVDKPPHAIVGRKSRGLVSSLNALRGKTLGAPVQDPAVEAWPVFRALHGLDERDWNIRLLTVGSAVREPMLVQGEIDAAIGSGPLILANLRARNVPGEDITVFTMADYGLALYGQALVASPAIMRDRPDAIRSLLDALPKSFMDLADNPGKAIEGLERRDAPIRPDVERERLNLLVQDFMLSPRVRAEGFGSVNPKRFEILIDQMEKAQGFRTRPRLEEVFEPKFLPSVERRSLSEVLIRP